MKYGKSIVKNSGMGMVYSGVMFVIQIISRRFFIQYIGVELLGISATCVSLLNTLSLAELGFQEAIVYNLYRPLANTNEEKINDIINIYKLIYRLIGGFIGIAAVALMPFLSVLFKGIEVNIYIYLVYFLQVVKTVCSYFVAYRRPLLYAAQKEYTSKLIDMINGVLWGVISIIILVVFRNYVLYMVVQILQVIASNLCIHWASSRYYPFLHKRPIDRNLLKFLWNDVKNIFAAKIAGYVYNSTDNLVISTFVGTLSVGMIANYREIAIGIRKLCSNFINPVLPVIGASLVLTDKGKEREKGFMLFSHIRFIVAGIIAVPGLILMQDFIILWLGKPYLLGMGIVVLIFIDMYIDLVHTACLNYIMSDGLFQKERNIEITGALINIIISLALVGRLGIAGVLIGTAMSQVYFWIFRSILLYRDCFCLKSRDWIRYWKKCLYWIFIIVVDFVLAKSACLKVVSLSGVPAFLVKGIICEAIFSLNYLILFYFSWEQKEIFRFINICYQKAKKQIKEKKSR